ncbi:hypothetical protein K7X08_033484 [Anisodus acutangulus]|uniref:Uncharacterized protein n=1 Tax=Anisodus acutangulus TaxID=402998 RepID=A0A9Q1M397_9SOLA|nr:hypothetical protein K7X08_033484 [Anisodus acutangulus]
MEIGFRVRNIHRLTELWKEVQAGVIEIDDEDKVNDEGDNPVSPLRYVSGTETIVLRLTLSSIARSLLLGDGPSQEERKLNEEIQHLRAEVEDLRADLKDSGFPAVTSARCH